MLTAPMSIPRAFPFAASVCAAAVTSLGAATAPEPLPRDIDHLTTLAEVAGYVRFFSPSDEATAADWDRVVIVGAEAARAARNTSDLKHALERVFAPLAPGLKLQFAEELAAATHAKAVADSGVLTFWQYAGLSRTDQPGPFRRRRVIRGGELAERKPLFTPVEPPPAIAEPLAGGLWITMPTALPTDEAGRTPKPNHEEATALQAQLAAVEIAKLGVDDWRLRVSGVVTVWTAFQHFHPYLQGDGWREALRPALEAALCGETREDYYRTLSAMIARTGDGHGYVYGRGEEFGGLSWRVTRAEGAVVVTAAEAEAPVRRGDVVLSVDGLAAHDALRALEEITPGSAHLREFRALNQFGEGPIGRAAQVIVQRGAGRVSVELPRRRERRGYFFKGGVEEFAFPGCSEVRPGIFYVNLYTVTPAEYQEHLPQLAAARGVIFDWRWGGRPPADPNGKQLQVHADVIPHLIDQRVQASPMLVPKVTQPNRVGWSYIEMTWPVEPKAPRFRGKVVFINEPSVVSYGETCMAMLADYRLATLVGAATAGCNGNASFIPLPGGFRVMWTAMEVRKHDRTVFYGTGFRPDVPVARTRRGIEEGRDEYLAAAIAWLDQQP